MAFVKESTVYDYLLDKRTKYGAGFLVLLDPDRLTEKEMVKYALKSEDAGVDALLIGTSLLMGNGFEQYIEEIKKVVNIPVIIFPGEKSHVSVKADAILFLSLFSGRNADLIIGEQVKAAPLIKAAGLEAISTAYLLIESGRLTSVEFMSNTRPIPSHKSEIALAHAYAAEIFGMRMVYLEAGSGAERPVPDDMVKTVSSNISIPVIVGGGLRSPITVEEKVKSGASFVVVGNHFEENAGNKVFLDFVKAAHG